jgi:hypothetical protein
LAGSRWFGPFAIGTIWGESGSEESAPVIPDCRESGKSGIHIADLWLWIPRSTLCVAPE